MTLSIFPIEGYTRCTNTLLNPGCRVAEATGAGIVGTAHQEYADEYPDR
ncbi:MAG: hypothetical protein R6W75_13065 [Smithellaceae bacterium]